MNQVITIYVEEPVPYVDNRYLEASVDLPVAAKVTSVSITYSNSYYRGGPGTWSFGSYAPATRNTVPVFSITPPNSAAASTVHKTGQPIATISAGRNYVIDWAPGSVDNRVPDTQHPIWYGATVRYTCAAPCVP